MTYSAFRIAAELARLDDGEINSMKLHKLAYYTQAYSLVDKGKPLFHEEIQAWKHGPVIPALWHRFAGQFSITSEQLPPITDPLDDDALRAVNAIWSTFGRLTGWELRSITHGETPWQMSYNATEQYHSTVIGLNAIKDFYSRKWISTNSRP